MKKTLLKLIPTVLLLATFLPAAVQAASQAVYYFTGRVSSFDSKRIVADGKEFLILDRCVYLKHTRHNKAMFEDKARPGDLRTGDSVVLHVNGTVVDKIIIEEWKR